MARLTPLPLVLALAACTASPSGPPWARIAAQADEGGLWMASESALLVVPGNLDPRATPTLTARDAVMTAWVPFSPNDCVVATSHYGTVTYTLDDCAGSFNLVHATGHLVVDYREPVAGDLVFHASTTDLVLNGEAVSFEADATVAHDTAAGVRTITLTIDTTGTGPAGTAFSRHGTQTARWLDSWGCLLVDAGDDTLTADGESWHATTSGLTYCVGECPMMDGAITWTGAEGSVQLGYGGTNTATWMLPTTPSQTGTLSIPCQI